MEMAVKALFAAFGAGFLAAQAVTLPADEGAQRQALKTLKGKERIDYAVAVRNARATSDALRLAPDDLEAVRRRADAYLYRYTRTNDGADAERALRLYNHEIKLREKEAHSADAYAYCRSWWGRLNAIYAHRVLDSRRRLQDFDTQEKTNIGKEKK